MGAWAPLDDGEGMDLDSVTDMAGDVDGSRDALGGGGGSGDGRAGGDQVGVRVDVADRADGGTGRAADEGVAGVVQGQKEAVMEDGGAHGGGVQGNADGAAPHPVVSGSRGGRADQRKSQQKQVKRRARQASQLDSPL